MTTSVQRSAFLELPGAVQASGVDAGVAAHYGSPIAEQRALAAGRAIVDLSNRSVITIDGPDRLSWLDSMSSQSIGRLGPGASAETLLLDPSGHIEHAMRLIDDGERLWVLVDAGEAAALLDFLMKMRFMLRVEPADRSDEFATIGALGAAGSRIPASESNGVRLAWADPWQAVVVGGHQYAIGAEHPGVEWTWTEALVPRTELEALADRVASGEFEPAGLLAAEALRIAAWRPKRATEVDEKSIPHELDWLRTAVHLNKGCYRGQETIAKVHNLGHPPRRLVLLHLDGSEGVLPGAGSLVWLGAGDERREVGRVTSSGIHHELGPVALAVVKRSTPVDEVLIVEADEVSVAASQEVIVPQDAGAEANIPRIPRLR